MKVSELLGIMPGDKLYNPLDESVFFVSEIDEEENIIQGILTSHEVDGHIIVFKVKDLAYSEILASWTKVGTQPAILSKISTKILELNRRLAKHGLIK